MQTSQHDEDERVGGELLRRFLAGALRLSHAPTLAETLRNLDRGASEAAERILGDPAETAARHDFARWVLSDLPGLREVVTEVYDPDLGRSLARLDRLWAFISSR